MYHPRRVFWRLCLRHLDFDREKALFLSRYFHDLGVFLHFQDESSLEKMVILQNEWATEAVFKIIDDEIVKAKSGMFTREDCRRVWHESQYEDMQNELLALMEMFELCYLLRDSQPATWLATQLLPPSLPATLTEWQEPTDIILLYHYDFMPQGIINRLMVRMNRYILQPNLAWQGGGLFEKADTQLLVTLSNTGKKITLRSHGPEAKALLNVIAHDLDAINDSFGGLKNKVNKYMPCICTECETSVTPHLHDEKELLKESPATNLPLNAEKATKEVSVLALLDGFKLDLPQWADGTEKAQAKKNHKQSTSPKEIKTKQLFLASSMELAEERDEFELFLRRENDRLHNQGLYIKVTRWEHFLDAMSETRLQDEYNSAVKSSDIFVSLFKSKAGKYTEEEFDVAYGNFKGLKASKIYTYFYDAPTTIGQVDVENLKSLRDFQDKLLKLGHFPTDFKNMDNLKLKFKGQLEILLDDYL